jgi:hypothetical protein
LAMVHGESNKNSETIKAAEAKLATNRDIKE